MRIVIRAIGARAMAPFTNGGDTSFASKSLASLAARVLGVAWLAVNSVVAALAQGTTAKPAEPAANANAPVVTIVFDASGSMWGKLPGDRLAKVALARKAIATALEAMPPTTRIGLVAFGHRRQGCTDVQTLHAPAPGGAEAVNELLEGINPRGRGPVTLALRQAVDGLPPGSAPARIVLIHDDLDNCGQDSCSMVDAIRAARPGLTIDVVSIGLKAEDAERMRCLTEGTRGRHLVAASGEEIDRAIREVLTVPMPSSDRVPGAVGPTPAPPTAQPGTTAGLARHLTEPPAPESSGLQLLARFGASTWTVDLPVRWRITPAESGGAQRTFLRHGGIQWLPLPPGRYRVEALLDGLSASREVEVVPQRPTLAALALEAGLVALNPSPQNLGPLGDVRLFAYPLDSPAKPAESAARHWIALGPRPVLALPPGRYRFELSHGAVRRTEIVEVKAGERYELAAPAVLGQLELAAIVRAGESPLDRVSFSIQEDDPRAPGGRREIARSAQPEPRIALPAGTYTIVVRRGSAEARERIAIGPGERVRRQITLPVGELQLGLTEEAEANLRLRTGDVQWRVVATGQEPGPPQVAYSTRANLDVPAGTYRIEGRFGRANASAVREFTVAAGSRVTARLSPRAARVTLRLARQSGTPSVGADTLWQVRDGSGVVVWTAAEPEASDLLQEGTYTVEVRTRAGRRTAAIEVRSGDNRLIEIEPPLERPH